MRVVVALTVLAVLAVSASGAGLAARAAEPTLVLDGGAPTGVSGACPGTMTFTVSGPATSSEHGFGQFTSSVSVTFAGGGVTAYTESFTATFGAATLTGSSSRDAALPLTGSCVNGVSVQGTTRTALTAPASRSGTSKVVISPSNHLNDYATDAAPPPPPPPDADGDGVAAPADCNDGNAAIRPGATEIRGNIVDENCDGIAEPFARLGSTLAYAFNVVGARTRVRTLTARAVPGGSTVRLACAAGRCGFARVDVRPPRDTASLPLVRYFRGRSLRPGVVVTVRISRPETIGKLFSLSIRRGRAPSVTVRCVPPGGTPRPC